MITITEARKIEKTARSSHHKISKLDYDEKMKAFRKMNLISNVVLMLKLNNTKMAEYYYEMYCGN